MFSGCITTPPRTYPGPLRSQTAWRLKGSAWREGDARPSPQRVQRDERRQYGNDPGGDYHRHGIELTHGDPDESPDEGHRERRSATQADERRERPPGASRSAAQARGPGQPHAMRHDRGRLQRDAESLTLRCGPVPGGDSVPCTGRVSPGGSAPFMGRSHCPSWVLRGRSPSPGVAALRGTVCPSWVLQSRSPVGQAFCAVL